MISQDELAQNFTLGSVMPMACLTCGADVGASMLELHLAWHRDQTWGKQPDPPGLGQPSTTTPEPTSPPPGPSGVSPSADGSR